MKWLIGLSLLALLTLFGAGYFLLFGGKDEKKNTDDLPETGVRSLTKPKTNAAPVVVTSVASSNTTVFVQNLASNAAITTARKEPKAGDKLTNQFAEAQVKKPKPPPEKPNSSYEYLADFAPDKVPESVATENEATDNTWRVYCLKETSTGALKVDEGEYVPGYKMAKGATNAKIYIGQRVNSGWKNDYTWVLFENPKLGQGFLYQKRIPGDDKKVIRIDVPFKCGEHEVDGSKLAALCPDMLKAFNMAGCIEVQVRIGEGDDLSNANNICVVDTQALVTDKRLNVKYGDKEIDAFLGKSTSFQSEPLKSYDVLRDKIGEMENNIAIEIRDLKEHEGELAKLIAQKAYIDNIPARRKAEIKEMDARIKKDEALISELQVGSKDEKAKKLIADNRNDIEWLRNQKFKLSKELEKGVKDQLDVIQAVIEKKQGEVNGIENTLNAHRAQLEQQKKVIADTLADLKRGMLPMTATVILDKPAKAKGMR